MTSCPPCPGSAQLPGSGLSCFPSDLLTYIFRGQDGEKQQTHVNHVTSFHNHTNQVPLINKLILSTYHLSILSCIISLSSIIYQSIIYQLSICHHHCLPIQLSIYPSIYLFIHITNILPTSPFFYPLAHLNGFSFMAKLAGHFPGVVLQLQGAADPEVTAPYLMTDQEGYRGLALLFESETSLMGLSSSGGHYNVS